MDRRLIVLTSGWGKVDLGWTFLSRKFRSAGFDVIWASYPLRGLVSIEESAQEVYKVLPVLNEEYDHITLIGHSMGGLIGRYIVQKMDGHNYIDSYVSIGTPHHGTPIAVLGRWSESAEQMRPNSIFLQDLNTTQWPNVPALTISGGFDRIVFPQARATFDGASDHAHIKKTTHTGLLLHPRCYQEIWGWLTYGVFQEVGFNNQSGHVSKLQFDTSTSQ